MLIRMWRKWNPCTLLVGMNGKITMKYCIKVPDKIKNKTTIWFNYPNSGYISRENKTITSKRYLYPHVMAALLTIVKV